VIDGAAPPRPGEELPLDPLAPYLRRVLGAGDEAPVRVSQFPGGHSNLTYLVLVGERELVLRRPPFGTRVARAHDMGREARILERLAPVWPRAPRPVHVCEDESIIGARFYLMERQRGVILRRTVPAGLAFDPRRVSEALVDGLVELHAIDWQAIGLGELGHPEGYVERQVTGWTKRYRDAQTDEVPDLDAVAAWLAAHRPASPPATILHNDYKYDNVVLDPQDLTRIVAVLDWEMATIGDPLMDLGTTLCYWVEPGDPDDVKALAFGPTALPGSLTRAQVAERYAEKSGRPVTHLRFYQAFGLFKTAVVIQQIYFRYKTGKTRDPRFAALGFGVGVLGREAARLLQA
jgi:aminoglycoside phosphotransferase (APT) family kinase protein